MSKKKPKIRHCCEPGCNTQIFGGKTLRCEPHRELAKERLFQSKLNAVKVKRREEREANPVFCLDGCGTKVYGTNKLCEDCKALHRKKSHKASPKPEMVSCPGIGCKNLMKSDSKHCGCQTPKPKSGPRKELSAEDIAAARQRDVEINNRYLASMGLVIREGKPWASECKVYTPEEIAQLAPKVTHISRIKSGPKLADTWMTNYQSR